MTMKVVCVANTKGDGKSLQASGDSKSLINAELLAAREKALTDVQNACKRYLVKSVGIHDLNNLFSFFKCT